MVKRIEPPEAGSGLLPKAQGRAGLAVMPTAQVLALRTRDPWREATDRARQSLCQKP